MTSKPVYHSKVIWFNILYILSIVVADDHFKDLFKDYGSYLIIIQTVINMGLRFVTTMPVTVKKTHPPTASDKLDEELNRDLKDF